MFCKLRETFSTGNISEIDVDDEYGYTGQVRADVHKKTLYNGATIYCIFESQACATLAPFPAASL